MKKEIKDRWLPKLRDPNTIQATGILHDTSTGGFCCLGVLCEVAVEDGIIEKRDLGDEGVYYGTPEEFEKCTAKADLLPASVVDWAGLDGDNPRVDVVDDEYCCDECVNISNKSLAEINDNYTPFSEIADLIEDQL